MYDFENHLIQQGGIIIVYDGDGNRVSKTVAGVTTSYLVDTVNPTGYAQVLTETGPNNEPTQYVYGLERISMREYFGSPTNDFLPFYYVYDGHGSVRALTGSAGTVTDTYDYDAFGNLIHSTGTTPNNYLYSGEQFDPDLHLYYNRARYLNVTTGRFWNMDAFEGLYQDPSGLHKFLYAAADPIGNSDPTGHDTRATTLGALPVALILATAVTLTLADACYAYATLTAGNGPCGTKNEDDSISFYRGTSYWEGLDFLSPNPDLTRFITTPDAQKYDYGAGFYMTRQLPDAVFFANLAGGFSTRPVKGGPALMNIQIKQSKWDILLSEGAKEGPMSGIPGQKYATQAYVPVGLIWQLKVFAQSIQLWPLSTGNAN